MDQEIVAALLAEIERHNREVRRLLSALSSGLASLPRSLTKRDQVRGAILSGPKTVRQIAQETGLTREEVRGAFKGMVSGLARWELATGEIAYGFDRDFRDRNGLPEPIVSADSPRSFGSCKCSDEPAQENESG